MERLGSGQAHGSGLEPDSGFGSSPRWWLVPNISGARWALSCPRCGDTRQDDGPRGAARGEAEHVSLLHVVGLG